MQLYLFDVCSIFLQLPFHFSNVLNNICWSLQSISYYHALVDQNGSHHTDLDSMKLKSFFPQSLKQHGCHCLFHTSKIFLFAKTHCASVFAIDTKCSFKQGMLSEQSLGTSSYPHGYLASIYWCMKCNISIRGSLQFIGIFSLPLIFTPTLGWCALLQSFHHQDSWIGRYVIPTFASLLLDQSSHDFVNFPFISHCSLCTHFIDFVCHCCIWLSMDHWWMPPAPCDIKHCTFLKH